MSCAAAINAMANDAAQAALLRCCGSRKWVAAMLDHRPFASDTAVFDMAEAIWNGLRREDWLEAFAAHPRIGDHDSLRKKFATTADLCSGEQAGVAGADELVLRDLADGNRKYEEKFGFIYIVCASGKSATEMLALLNARLQNEPKSELKIAAAEQAKITRLRLEKL